ncbi:hypothetical protein EC973_002437 [Apophysomyces ossiformis]|uniref:Major facilitator superfamily (MFS) profile domain-containing protein n=1 Tax=Apophysomyces ossiformis TaxID=679940 RepID=A0A8H7BIB9_9FUNG|nr:hypothetical protein EC973_002437 [Apophysomyces ossiformis]
MSAQPDARLAGVKKVELYKQVWNKIDRIVIFSGVVLLSWAISWESNLVLTVTPGVTSNFGSNNLSSLLPTVLYILQTVLLPAYSKLSDNVGRAEAYSISLLFYMLAYIVMATAQSYSTLVGGQVIYAFGYSGTSVLGPILIGDMTTVLDRGLFQGLYNIPTLINIFVTALVGEELLKQGQWRWAYGMIPILLFVASSPLMVGLWNVQFKVKRAGLLDNKKDEQQTTPKSGKYFAEKIIWFMNEIDLIGSVLMVAGLCLILLPLVLALPRWGGWQSGITIGTLVAGVVAWILFGIWEWKFANKPLIPLGQWPSRTPIFGVLAVSTVTVISSTNWQFFLTYLMVSRKIGAKTAVYLERGYNVAYILMQVATGYLMKRTRVWRPFVWAGIALMILGIGLMIPARLPTSSDAFVVISQTIVGIGSGMLDIPILVAIQSSVPHNGRLYFVFLQRRLLNHIAFPDLAIVTALFNVGGSIAASIGSTMAGTIWNNVLPEELMKNVPGDVDYSKIMGSIDYAISLPEDQYQGTVVAYGHVQMILSIIALAISVLTFLFTLPMKSFGLDQNEEKSTAVGAEAADEMIKLDKL